MPQQTVVRFSVVIALVVGLAANAGAFAADATPSAPAAAVTSGTPPPVVGYPVHMDLSAPLGSIEGAQDNGQSARGNDRGAKDFGHAGQAPVGGSAPAALPVAGSAPAPSTSWDGVGQGFTGPAGAFTVQYAPPDTNGAVGPNHYVQTVNVSLAVFNKTTGTVLYGPVPINTLWSGFGGGCQIDNDGDPTVIYDPIADRWLISQFAVTTTRYLNCVAVSKTSDPLGAYWRYSYAYTDFPDYPKFGVWPDGYYVSMNMFRGGSTFNGAGACAYDRAKMIAGDPTAAQICFFTSTAYGGLLPSTLDGKRPPPTGTPNYFVALDTNTTLVSWKFRADFTIPANSTFSGPTSLTVAPYAAACNGGACIPQAGTSQRLDSLADRLMYRLAYRNFGGHESLVVNHSVTAGSSVGIRWYELRVTGVLRDLSVFQQGTYAPDASYRWMGSIAMDQAGDIALGYSTSSATLRPGIGYTGRLPSDALGIMGQGEATIITGGGSQTGGLSRWGDYSSLTVDPVDDCTFWYTTEYLKSSGSFNWSTRIASFKFPSCLPATQAPTITSAASTTFTVGVAGTFTVTTTGVPAPTIVRSGADLPSGVTFTNNGNGTGTLAGTALTNGSHAITFTATNGNAPDAVQSFTLTVNSPSGVPGQPAPPSATAGPGKGISLAWTAPPNGGSAITGYALNRYVGCVLSTTPVVIGTGNVLSYKDTSTVARTSYCYTIVATNSVGTGLASLPSATVTPRK